MQTTYKKQEQENAPKKHNRFLTGLWNILGGEILLNKNAKPVYLYLLFLLFFFVLMILSDKRIQTKQEKIKQYQTEYREVISNLKKNNQFIPYQENQELLQMVKERGFVKSDKNCYKIVVKEEAKE